MKYSAKQEAFFAKHSGKREQHSASGELHSATPTVPCLLRRAANYVGAVVRYRRNHGWMLPLELAQPRHTTCQTNKCGKYDAQLDRCLHRKCGCSLAEKVTWSTEKCPEEYWLAVYGPAPQG